MKPRRTTTREWGVIIRPGLPSDKPNLLGSSWFNLGGDLPLGVNGYPARFRSRRAAREAIEEKYATGYFAGRLRVVRLTCVFDWVPS